VAEPANRTDKPRTVVRVESAGSRGDGRAAVFTHAAGLRIVVADGAGSSGVGAIADNQGAETTGVVLEVRDGVVSGASASSVAVPLSPFGSKLLWRGGCL